MQYEYAHYLFVTLSKPGVLNKLHAVKLCDSAQLLLLYFAGVLRNTSS